MLTIVQCLWCLPFDSIFWNPAPTKGELLIRRKPIDADAAPPIGDDNKHGLLFFYSPPSPPFHPYQKSPLNHSIHAAHPLSPPTSPLQSSMISPLWQREQTERGGGMEWEREREIGKERDPRDPSRLSFPLFGYAALPRFHGSGKLCSFPLRGPSSPQSKAL